MAIKGRHRAPRWLQKVINGPFVAISRPGGSKLVDQRGSRLDLVRAHPGRCVATYSWVWNGHRGRHRAPKWLGKAINGPFVAISRSGGSKLVNQGWINLGHIHNDVLGPLPRSRMAIGGRRRHMVQKVLFMAVWPLLIMMAILEVEKVSNTLPRMCPN